MAAQADEIFALSTTELTSAAAWIGMLAYTFQIYFDFSGYSDMAIGLGKMLGFKFPENFDNPYTSQSITEFWRRWHMTLGSWMKNYLYIPLGGNKVQNKMRLYFNLWLVFLASGFWHGASWTFIIWGIYHGFFLVLERVFLLKTFEKIGKFLSTVITFFIVGVGWIFFRADTVRQALSFTGKLFSFQFTGVRYYPNGEFVFYLLLAIFFSFSTSFRWGRRLQQKVYFSEYGVIGYSTGTLLSCVLFVLALAAIASGEVNPFIYFRF
jgi:alginate O-acetyltransferase complex protein AlgI